MIIDKPGLYKTKNGDKREVEFVGKDYAVARSPFGLPIFYHLDGTAFGGYDPIISAWTDPPKPLEFYVNELPGGMFSIHDDEDDAKHGPHAANATRTAVHMREVIE